MDVPATLTSIVAAAISLVALVRTRKFNARVMILQDAQAELIKLQRQNLEREEAKLGECKVRARCYKGTNDSDRIMVYNAGAVDAFEVQCVFDSIDGNSSPAIESEMNAIFPIKCLQPNDDRNFLIAPSMDTGHRWQVTLTWKNSEGREYRFSKPLEMG